MWSICGRHLPRSIACSHLAGRSYRSTSTDPQNAAVRAVYLAYLTIVGATLGFILHRDPNTYRYIPESIRLYPGAAGVGRLMTETGFMDVRIVPLLSGLMAIHVGTKRRP